MSIFGDQMLGKLLLDVSAGILNAGYLGKSQKFNVTGTKCSHYPLGHSPLSLFPSPCVSNLQAI